MKSLTKASRIACYFALFLIFPTAGSTAAEEAIGGNVPAVDILALKMPVESAAAAAKPTAVVLADSFVPIPVPRASIRGTTTHQSTPAKFFTISQVLAKRNRGASRTSAAMFAALDVAEVASDATPAAIPSLQGNAPFGLFAFRAPQGTLWVKWRGLEADIKAKAPALARCEGQPAACSAAEARFAAIVKSARTQKGIARLEFVNQRVNESIRYQADIIQWHEADRWSAPLDTNGKGSFETGLGDCEDYAIAKYTALRNAGMSTKDLQLVLLRDDVTHIAHAVLAARQNGHWLILDNRSSSLIEDSEMSQFTPLFALNDEGVKLFAAPYASIQDMKFDDTRSGNQNFSTSSGAEFISTQLTPLLQGSWFSIAQVINSPAS